MVHKQPPQFQSHAQNPPPRRHRLEGTGRESRGHGRGSATFVIVYEAQPEPGARRSGAEGWKGKEAGKDKDASSGSRPPLRTPGASISPRNKRAKAAAGASPETFPAPKLARLSLDTRRHVSSPPAPARGVGAGAASHGPGSRRRGTPHPRTHLPPVAPAAGSASTRTAASPAPVRSLLPAPPSPRPREVGPAAAPESRGGPPELSRALPPRLLGGWAGPTRP
ncbi:sterile alpha motif domain-containing protein 1-like [Camelus dromedarius]|uniref:sterile alpha motif domain-containing protein 1-like n=1 Tax=Camelus dromedarius TaxID=9838 RepID=UPI00311A76F0